MVRGADASSPPEGLTKALQLSISHVVCCLFWRARQRQGDISLPVRACSHERRQLVWRRDRHEVEVPETVVGAVGEEQLVSPIDLAIQDAPSEGQPHHRVALSLLLPPPWTSWRLCPIHAPQRGAK